LRELRDPGIVFGIAVVLPGIEFFCVLTLSAVVCFAHGDLLSSLAISSEFHSPGSLASQNSFPPKPYIRLQEARPAPANKNRPRREKASWPRSSSINVSRKI
jgi:hypothetical protein